MKNLLNNLQRIANRVFVIDEYKKFLELAARFPNLSLYNLLLLYYQMPTATLVAGQNAWKDNYGLDVKEDARAICLVRPTIIDEEETTLGYAQIGVFDISQLETAPEVKREEFSIPDFFNEQTSCVLAYDNEGFLGDSDYEIIEDEIFVKYYEHLSEEENEKNASKQMLCAYIDRFCELELSGVREKVIAQSAKYILCTRYNLPVPQLSAPMIANCKSYGLEFLLQILELTNRVIDLIENQISVELNFSEIAFVNLLVEANSKEEYDSILELDLEDDDSVLEKDRSAFVEKLELLSPRDFNQIFEDRENKKTLTQPPYKIKLIEEA